MLSLQAFLTVNTRNELTYEDGVDLGGVVNMAVDGAGVDTNSATIRINSDDVANVTDLNISTGDADSYLEIDVDDAPGAGTPAAFENLTISGVGGLFLREENLQGETDDITTVDSTGLEGFLDLDLGNNDEDIDFNGGDGDTTLVTGDGDSTINTGAGDDSIDVSGTGDNTVDAGDGDDFVNFGAEANTDDSASGGAGDADVIGIDVDVLDGLTADGDFEGVIDGFEQVYALNQVPLAMLHS